MSFVWFGCTKVRGVLSWVEFSWWKAMLSNRSSTFCEVYWWHTLESDIFIKGFPSFETFASVPNGRNFRIPSHSGKVKAKLAQQKQLYEAAQNRRHRRKQLWIGDFFVAIRDYTHLLLILFFWGREIILVPKKWWWGRGRISICWRSLETLTSLSTERGDCC